MFGVLNVSMQMSTKVVPRKQFGEAGGLELFGIFGFIGETVGLQNWPSGLVFVGAWPCRFIEPRVVM